VRKTFRQAGLVLAGALVAQHAMAAEGAAPMKASPKLNYFSEAPPNSGAATFNLGDRFTGPGFVTVGWLGSKKQVVLPAGEWVVLAAVDHNSTGTRPVKLATFVFGKFSGDRLAASLTVTVNRNASPVNRWSDIEACAQPDAGQLHQEATSMSAMQTECVRMHGAAAALAGATPLGDELRSSLKRIGARAGGTAIVTQMYVADRRDGYMRIQRTDWPAVALGNTEAADWQPDAVARSDVRSAYVKELVRWVQGYRPVAIQGFHRALDGDELAAGNAVRGLTGVAGIGEFEPSAAPPR